MANSSFGEILIGTMKSSTHNVTSMPIIEDLCATDSMPDYQTYSKAMGVYGRILFTYGAGIVLFIFVIFIDTATHIMKHSHSRYKTPTAIIISVYPVAASVTYCAMLVPRAYILAETTTHLVFMCGVYQLFRLYIAYIGGEAELIKRVEPARFDPQVGPCCCWPCCVCLPRLAVNKKNMTFLRVLVIQLPVVQGFIYMIHLTMWAERQESYRVNFAFVQPFIITTMMFGIWAMKMVTKVLGSILPGHRLMGKMYSLQLTNLLSQVLSLLLRILVISNVIPCEPPLTVGLCASLIYNSTMLTVLFILAYWSRSLYKTPLGDVGAIIPGPLEDPLIECIKLESPRDI